MADETQLESGQSGEQELPTPSFSDKGDSSTSSGADELVSKLIPQLEQIIERKVQSVKDRRFSEIEKVLGGRDKMLAELEEYGVSIPKEARQEMRLRELEERLSGSPTQPAQVSVDGSTAQKAAVTEAIAELKEAGLEVDADVIAILRGQYSNRAAFDLAIQKHINKKLRPEKPANPADVIQGPARQGADSNIAAQIEKGYLEEMKTVPRGNVRMISKVQAKWRQKAREAGLQLNV